VDLLWKDTQEIEIQHKVILSTVFTIYINTVQNAFFHVSDVLSIHSSIRYVQIPVSDQGHTLTNKTDPATVELMV
jgi:hypothetical protein